MHTPAGAPCKDDCLTPKRKLFAHVRSLTRLFAHVWPQLAVATGVFPVNCSTSARGVRKECEDGADLTEADLIIFLEAWAGGPPIGDNKNSSH